MLTTTIGAYPKPEAVPIRDWFQKEGGTDTPEPTAGYAETLRQYGARLEAILDRATTQVVREQVELGIDIPTDGEIRRENFIHYHCRHLRGIDFDALTERQVRGDHHERSCRPSPGRSRPGRRSSCATGRSRRAPRRRPVKITVPGPLTIGEHVADEYYREDARARGAALADALNVEIRRLAEAGCPVIQIDEPAFARKVEDALAFGAEHLERCFHRVPPTHRAGRAHLLRLSRHGSMPRTTPRRRTQPISSSQACSTRSRSMRSRSRTRTGRNDLALLERFARRKVILGVIAIARSRIEEVEEVRDRLRAAHGHIDAHRLLAAPDCGLGLLGRDLARDKLKVLTEAAHSL